MMNNEETPKAKRFDLEERLIDYSVLIAGIVETIPNTKAGNHFAGQLIRSGTSPALNYAEAQSGESRRDFIHKLKIVLKELKETRVALKIVKLANMYPDLSKLEFAMQEINELIAIFITSVNTAIKNLDKG